VRGTVLYSLLKYLLKSISLFCLSVSKEGIRSGLEKSSSVTLADVCDAAVSSPKSLEAISVLEKYEGSSKELSPEKSYFSLANALSLNVSFAFVFDIIDRNLASACRQHYIPPRRTIFPFTLFRKP